MVSIFNTGDLVDVTDTWYEDYLKGGLTNLEVKSKHPEDNEYEVWNTAKTNFAYVDGSNLVAASNGGDSSEEHF